jgi:hypothetical protein
MFCLVSAPSELPRSSRVKAGRGDTCTLRHTEPGNVLWGLDKPFAVGTPTPGVTLLGSIRGLRPRFVSSTAGAEIAAHCSSANQEKGGTSSGRDSRLKRRPASLTGKAGAIRRTPSNAPRCLLRGRPRLASHDGTMSIPLPALGCANTSLCATIMAHAPRRSAATQKASCQWAGRDARNPGDGVSVNDAITRPIVPMREDPSFSNSGPTDPKSKGKGGRQIQFAPSAGRLAEEMDRAATLPAGCSRRIPLALRGRGRGRVPGNLGRSSCDCSKRNRENTVYWVALTNTIYSQVLESSTYRRFPFEARAEHVSSGCPQTILIPRCILHAVSWPYERPKSQSDSVILEMHSIKEAFFSPSHRAVCVTVVPVKAPYEGGDKRSDAL